MPEDEIYFQDQNDNSTLKVTYSNDYFWFSGGERDDDSTRWSPDVPLALDHIDRLMAFLELHRVKVLENRSRTLVTNEDPLIEKEKCRSCDENFLDEDGCCPSCDYCSDCGKHLDDCERCLTCDNHGDDCTCCANCGAAEGRCDCVDADDEEDESEEEEEIKGTVDEPKDNFDPTLMFVRKDKSPFDK